MNWNKLNRNTTIIIICLTFLLIVIALPILSNLNVWKFKTIFNIAKDIANFQYLISGSLLVLGLYLTLRQVELIKDDMKIRNNRASVEKSIDYLNIFANEIIPKINAYDAYLESKSDKKDIIVSNWNPSESNYHLDIFSLPKEERTVILLELKKRSEGDLLLILNNLEFFSAGIIHGLAKDDVVYDPIANSFIDFVSQEIVEISSQRHYGNPYENTIELYKNWKSRKNSVQVALQIEELESKLEERKSILEVAMTTAKPIKHIGK